MAAPVSAQATLGDQVAVFIDLENLALGAGEDLPGQADPIPYKALELLCRDYGNTSIRRAYADWSRPEFGKPQNNPATNGIDERRAVAAMEESPDASATGSWLKSKMLALDPSFDERNYGASSFRVLLSRLPDLVEVTKDQSSSDMLVTLVASRQAKAAAAQPRQRKKSAATQPAAEPPTEKQPAAKRTRARQTKPKQTAAEQDADT